MIFKSQQSSSLIAVRLLTESGAVESRPLIHLVRQLKWNCRELRFHRKCWCEKRVCSLGFSLAFPRNKGCLASTFPEKSPPADGASVDRRLLSPWITSSWTSYTINYISLFLINDSFRTHIHRKMCTTGCHKQHRKRCQGESCWRNRWVNVFFNLHSCPPSHE